MTKEKAMEITRKRIHKHPGIVFYCGVPIQEFTKEELIEILSLMTYKMYSRVERLSFKGNIT